MVSPKDVYFSILNTNKLFFLGGVTLL